MICAVPHCEAEAVAHVLVRPTAQGVRVEGMICADHLVEMAELIADQFLDLNRLSDDPDPALLDMRARMMEHFAGG